MRDGIAEMVRRGMDSSLTQLAQVAWRAANREPR